MEERVDFALPRTARRNGNQQIGKGVVFAIEVGIAEEGITRMIGPGLGGGDAYGEGVKIGGILRVRFMREKRLDGVGGVGRELGKLSGRVTFRENNNIKTVGTRAVGQDSLYGRLGGKMRRGPQKENKSGGPKMRQEGGRYSFAAWRDARPPWELSHHSKLK